MVRFAQFVIGPAGSGKSTYCYHIQSHSKLKGRTFNAINLDPGADYFHYDTIFDIKNEISVTDIQKSNLQFGPNGGLMYCMEHFSLNMDRLMEAIGDGEDEYFLFDCPGQIELYCVSNIMENIINTLQDRYGFRICTVYIINYKYITSSKTYISVMQSAYAASLKLMCPHLSVMTKVDQLSKRNKRKLTKLGKLDMMDIHEKDNDGRESKYNLFRQKFAEFCDEMGVGGFDLFDISQEFTIDAIIAKVDRMLQVDEVNDINALDFDDEIED